MCQYFHTLNTQFNIGSTDFHHIHAYIHIQFVITSMTQVYINFNYITTMKIKKTFVYLVRSGLYVCMRTCFAVFTLVSLFVGSLCCINVENSVKIVFVCGTDEENIQKLKMFSRSKKWNLNVCKEAWEHGSKHNTCIEWGWKKKQKKKWNRWWSCKFNICERKQLYIKLSCERKRESKEWKIE